MRVVLDTNVIIAAFAARGLCAEVFEICLSDHTVILSEHILSETYEKLIKKVRLPQDSAQNIIDYLRDTAEVVEPELVDESVCRDKDDTRVIGAALKGKAKFIITGDDDLLVIKSYKGVKIITPREFWGVLREG
ncbi:MAG: putative toxin-antitoxin system toxin component, PIN family [Deltaproteobacteria bacterium]|nr:putative toxin-antitoxin system toxin component, PIN family [Deltaproteobacteria bacterium]